MNFTVDLTTVARNDLAEVWTAAPDQAAVTAASAAIDRLLALDPIGFGQHVSEGLWRIRIPPLVAHYTIDPDRRRVEVTDIARTA